MRATLALNGLMSLSIFAKCYILDVRQGSEFAFDILFQLFMPSRDAQTKSNRKK